ncbi:uncharacterized protein LOC112556046 [Pomacea canaliculata]|uniref:uncharacterized protein LOC112556046 n=1 Tax=Pomacea canaliculata TaxID=400727 RepID=UPI000D727711|nr:uncharacterized protein LOC112556046 [Pomacea canaliculata]
MVIPETSNCQSTDMNMERRRYGTFSLNMNDWMNNWSPRSSPCRLAKEGYFYDFFLRRVRCYNCGHAPWGHRVDCTRHLHNVPFALLREEQALQLRRHVQLVAEEEDSTGAPNHW